MSGDTGDCGLTLRWIGPSMADVRRSNGRAVMVGYTQVTRLPAGMRKGTIFSGEVAYDWAGEGMAWLRGMRRKSRCASGSLLQLGKNTEECYATEDDVVLALWRCAAELRPQVSVALRTSYSRHPKAAVSENPTPPSTHVQQHRIERLGV